MKNRKIRHGVRSVALTAGVLLAVILFNLLFGLLASRFLWVIDTMPNDLVRISDYSRELLDEVNDEENDITIYFLADPDELENYELIGHQAGESDSTWGMSYVYNLAKLYEREYSFIQVKLLDSSKDADYIRKNFALTIGSELSPLTVVFENNVNGLRTYRTMQRDTFFSFSSTSMYFRGEDRFTSAILSLSGKNPVAYFVEGHGEKVGAPGDSEDFGEAAALASLFTEAGYIVKKIDLSEADFEEAAGDAYVGNAAVVVLYGPESDFETDGAGGVNEITRLRRFLNDKNRNLMVFMDPGVPAMPNLDEYLEDFWGVGFEDNIIVADTSDPNTSSAISEDGTIFYGDYELSDNSPGSALTSSLTNLDSLPGAFFGPTRTIRMNRQWSSSNDATMVMEGVTSYKLGPAFRAPALSAAVYQDGASFACYDSNVYEAYAALYYQDKYDEIYPEYREKYYQSAYDRHLEEKGEEYREEGLSESEIAEKCDEYASSYVDEEVEAYMDSYLSLDTSSTPAILTLTHANWMYAQSETISSYMLACGSTAYASEDALSNAAYSNRDTLYSAIYLFGKNVLPYDLDIIKIVDSSSLSIREGTAVAWSVFLSVLLPLIPVGAGIAVLVKRKKKNR